MLGFLKTLPSDCVGYWSSGTGLAGLFATLLIIGLRAKDVSYSVIYLAASPTAILYSLALVWLDQQKRLYRYIPEPDDYEQESET